MKNSNKLRLWYIKQWGLEKNDFVHCFLVNLKFNFNILSWSRRLHGTVSKKLH
jgi:hypothetical protein